MSEMATNTTVISQITPQSSGPEVAIAKNIALRGVLIAPVVLAFGGLFAGWAGLWSVAYGLALVVCNFLMGAAIINWSAKISKEVMFGAVMVGFVARLAVITVAVLLIGDAGWFEAVPFSVALILSHFGLLIWETRRLKVIAL